VLRIRNVAASAGVSTQLLRVWERRYGLVHPVRTDSGYRVYSEDDVLVLRGAKSLVDQGVSIAEVARLPRERLREAGTATTPTPSPLLEGSQGTTGDLFPESAIRAINRLDGESLERVLYVAMGMGALSSREICEQVLIPLLQTIGDRWEHGELSVAAEHFGSSIVRNKLVALLSSASRAQAGAPVVVCACPTGEQHEGALLSFAVHAAALGFAVVYLGADTPIDQIILAADLRSARAIAISVSRDTSQHLRTETASALGNWRRSGSGRGVLVGGRSAQVHRADWEAVGLTVVEDAAGALAFLQGQ
jgi:MerR family transcriptional regulator, light-induced transcriptional regulator